MAMGHLLPFFVVLAFGLSFSVLAIVLELMLGLSEEKIIAQANSQKSNINSDKRSGECKGESAIEIREEGIMEPTIGISAELKNKAKEEPNIAKEKDCNNLITVLVEIQEGLNKEQSTRENFQGDVFNVSATSLNSLDIMEIEPMRSCPHEE